MADSGDQYLLQDGTYAAPGDCSKGADGALRHKNGVAVALRDDGEPMTLAKVTEHNVAAAEAAAVSAPGEPAVDNAAAAEQPAPAVRERQRADVPLAPPVAPAGPVRADPAREPKAE